MIRYNHLNGLTMAIKNYIKKKKTIEFQNIEYKMKIDREYNRLILISKVGKIEYISIVNNMPWLKKLNRNGST
ncbi:MAG: hypothetical protein GF317_23395 [Candidatus Lokiarchaeota archaeon]|nr:hypothetical protein [Candidatus Lokiarchaeota archaeon]